MTGASPASPLASPSTSTSIPTLVRVLWFVSIFFGGLGLLLYIGMAIIVPLEPQPAGAEGEAAVEPEGHRHAARGDGRWTTFLGAVLILFGGVALVDAFLPAWQDAVPVPRARRSSSGSARCSWRGPSTRFDRIVIGGAVLILGLLLVVAALVSTRIPGGASIAQSGIDRSRAFLLSPIHPATWYANGAIALGFVVGIGAFAVVVSIASAGLTTLFFGIGVVFLGLAIEAARLVARVERWRVFAGSAAARPAAHAYRPLRGGILGILRAEFGDESRWRDALYVAVNLPLAIIEFVVAPSCGSPRSPS